MKVVIVEDERPAMEKLKKALHDVDNTVEISAALTSVKDAIDYFKNNTFPDLVFMDIELSDGTAFEIFERVKVQAPVIFITAYDEYWQRAFELNSIDYLLKPMKNEKLLGSLLKYKNLKQHFEANYRMIIPSPDDMKKRFLVKKGAEYLSIKTDDIAYFFATQRVVFLVTNAGRKFIIDQTLMELEKMLEPSAFFRANRKFIISISAIKKIKSHPRSKLMLELTPSTDDEVIISQENLNTFKKWLNGQSLSSRKADD